jgi:hypothetical protein
MSVHVPALGPAAAVSVGASGLTFRVRTASRLRRGHPASPSAGRPPRATFPPAAGARHSIPASYVRTF